MLWRRHCVWWWTCVCAGCWRDVGWIQRSQRPQTAAPTQLVLLWRRRVCRRLFPTPIHTAIAAVFGVSGVKSVTVVCAVWGVRLRGGYMSLKPPMGAAACRCAAFGFPHCPSSTPPCGTADGRQCAAVWRQRSGRQHTAPAAVDGTQRRTATTHSSSAAHRAVCGLVVGSVCVCVCVGA